MARRDRLTTSNRSGIPARCPCFLSVLLGLGIFAIKTPWQPRFHIAYVLLLMLRFCLLALPLAVVAVMNLLRRLIPHKRPSRKRRTQGRFRLSRSRVASVIRRLINLRACPQNWRLRLARGINPQRPKLHRCRQREPIKKTKRAAKQNPLKKRRLLGKQKLRAEKEEVHRSAT